MKRGVGYCENTECEDYAKGVFLLNHGDTFYCPRCRQLGKVEKERGFYTGNSDIFKEVRVEYNFDPVHGIYREIAIVRDNAHSRLPRPFSPTSIATVVSSPETTSPAPPRSSSPSTTATTNSARS
jgi:ribosomal protein S27AE